MTLPQTPSQLGEGYPSLILPPRRLQLLHLVPPLRAGQMLATPLSISKQHKNQSVKQCGK